METGPLRLSNVAVGVLEAIDLTVEPGEIVCLSGPSGSGKTRLLRAVADLEPHDGEIRLGAQRQSEMAAHRWRRQVMLVPSESQWWSDRVGAHFCREASDHLAILGFEATTFDWSVSRLSSGEKQRLGLLRALNHEPRALLLDEPTANLDPDLTQRVEQWLVELAREQGIPILWVAHDPGQIERIASHHYQLRGNRVERA